MKTFFLSAATAAALVLSPASYQTAQANDLSDVLGPLLGLAILGAVINEATDDNDDKVRTQTTSRQSFKPHHKSHRAQRRVLPSQCIRVLETRRADRIVLPERCLNNRGIRNAQLPNRCERRVSTRNGGVTVYGARCLADAGWRLPRLRGQRR